MGFGCLSCGYGDLSGRHGPAVDCRDVRVAADVPGEHKPGGPCIAPFQLMNRAA